MATAEMFILPWPNLMATAEWTILPWPWELWVDRFHCFNWTRDRTTRPLQNAVSAVAWTQAQVVSSNSTSRVKETQVSTYLKCFCDLRAVADGREGGQEGCVPLSVHFFFFFMQFSPKLCLLTIQIQNPKFTFTICTRQTLSNYKQI